MSTAVLAMIYMVLCKLLMLQTSGTFLSKVDIKQVGAKVVRFDIESDYNIIRSGISSMRGQGRFPF